MTGLLFRFCFRQLNSKPVNFLIDIVVRSISFVQLYNSVDNRQSKSESTYIGRIVAPEERRNQFFECGMDAVSIVVEMNEDILIVVADRNVYLFVGGI